MGQALKWAQREHALHKGIRRITWTFDPMQSGNAHLNIQWLGATACEYLSDFYGVTSSDLHYGLPTDRLLASWKLDSARVERLFAGTACPPIEERTRVAIPRDWGLLVKHSSRVARDEQRRVERELRAGFDSGLRVRGFDKISSSYLLAADEEPVPFCRPGP